MGEDKITLDFGHQALALSEEHEDVNLQIIQSACDILKKVAALMSDLVANHERLVESTATLRYLNAE